MNKLLISVLTVSLLAGCASDNVKKAELHAVQKQMNELSQENAKLRQQLGQVESSMKEVKGRKFVQLPTGSPTQLESRNTGNTTSSANNNLANQASGEAGIYQEAVQTYKSGDIASGVKKLTRYRQDFPKGKHYDEASYYLAQAYYSERNYDYASQVLEPLVFDKPREAVNVSIAKLLRDVYTASNSTEKLTKLNQLMASSSGPAASKSTGSKLVTEDGVEVKTPQATDPLAEPAKQ